MALKSKSEKMLEKCPHCSGNIWRNLINDRVECEDCKYKDSLENFRNRTMR